MSNEYKELKDLGVEWDSVPFQEGDSLSVCEGGGSQDCVSDDCADYHDHACPCLLCNAAYNNEFSQRSAFNAILRAARERRLRGDDEFKSFY